jgi:hypothetical protein
MTRRLPDSRRGWLVGDRVFVRYGGAGRQHAVIIGRTPTKLVINKWLANSERWVTANIRPSEVLCFDDEQTELLPPTPVELPPETPEERARNAAQADLLRRVRNSVPGIKP